MDVAAVLIASLALVTSIVVAVKQHSQAQAAAKTDGRFLAIEETRFEWDQEAREAARVPDGTDHRVEITETITVTDDVHHEPGQSADFGVRFGFRDSAQTWGRLIARNNGPTDAREVSLVVGAEVDGTAVAVEPVGGTDYGEASVLQPNESVHVGVAFSFGSPGPADLTYTLSWTDDLGPHVEQKRVPLY